jgi:GntR family transcriptional repressor for pyruvate dehydrogenase complex
MSEDTQTEKRTRQAFKPAKPIRTYESVVQQIEDAIYSGALQPGERLPSERDLVAQFGVSRASIREALRVVESSGLIRSKPGDPSGGAEVLALSSATLQRSLMALVKMERLKLGVLVEFRMVIEGAATYLGAQMRSEEQLQHMKEAHSQMEAAIGRDIDAFARLDADFHQIVAESASNDLLRACNEVSRGMILMMIGDKLSQAEDTVGLQRETWERHGRVLEAIESRDGATAAFRAKVDLAEYYSPFMEAVEAKRVQLLAQRSATFP